jgi:hypothetical protein
MGNLALIVGFLTAAPILLYVERKLTFLVAFGVVTGGLWTLAPEMGFGDQELRFVWIILGVIAGAFAAVSAKK